MIPYFELSSLDLGLITINVWGLLVALGFLVSILVAIRIAKRLGLKAEYLIDCAILVIISSLIGGRVFYVLNEWSRFAKQPVEVFKIWDGGLAIYGGIIFAFISGWLYLKIKHLSFWPYAEIVFYVLPLGFAIGRIGCFLIHDHLGRITSVPWGIKMPDGSIRHETAMYEIIFCLILFIFFELIRKRKYCQISSGCFTSIFFIAYGLFRFFSDSLRATDLAVSDPVVWLNLRPSQIFSVFFIIAGLFLFFIKARANRKEIDK